MWLEAGTEETYTTAAIGRFILPVRWVRQTYLQMGPLNNCQSVGQLKALELVVVVEGCLDDPSPKVAAVGVHNSWKIARHRGIKPKKFNKYPAGNRPHCPYVKLRFHMSTMYSMKNDLKDPYLNLFWGSSRILEATQRKPDSFLGTSELLELSWGSFGTVRDRPGAISEMPEGLFDN